MNLTSVVVIISLSVIIFAVPARLKWLSQAWNKWVSLRSHFLLEASVITLPFSISFYIPSQRLAFSITSGRWIEFTIAIGSRIRVTT